MRPDFKPDATGRGDAERDGAERGVAERPGAERGEARRDEAERDEVWRGGANPDEIPKRNLLGTPTKLKNELVEPYRRNSKTNFWQCFPNTVRHRPKENTKCLIWNQTKTVLTPQKSYCRERWGTKNIENTMKMVN